MLQWFANRLVIRIVLGIIIGCVALLAMGTGEFIRCVRWMFPPTIVTFDQASTEGLAKFGHARLDGARFGDKYAAVMDKSGGVKGLYVPLVAEKEDAAPAQCRVVAWIPDARGVEDAVAFVERAGFEGFVDSTAEMLDPSRQPLVRSLAFASTQQIWMLEMRRPSWSKGLGLFGGGLLLGGVLVFFLAQQRLDR